MSDLAIRVEGLSKQYRLGPRQRYRTLRESLSGLFTSPSAIRNSQSAIPNPQSDKIWALRDVSFEIKQGEVVGVIGRNGAGKTTLLKILSQITEPTTGYADIHGRVGSLLEVGTGFHPELTGRENIYLNGAILGMRKHEITRKFDEIVAFAEVEKFLDTPVKHYSSGMRVRLAFAVAAHLEPEILLIDEVLAVGDIAFQKKCIRKMEEVTGQGRTVLLVSHNLSTVKALCERALLLDGGTLRQIGPVEAVIQQYLASHQADSREYVVTEADHLTGVGKIRIDRLRLLDGAGPRFTVFWRQPITVQVDLTVREPVENVSFGAGLRGLDGTKLFTTHHDDDGRSPLWNLAAGRYQLEFTLHNEAAPGLYKLHVGADREHLRQLQVCAVEPVTIEVLGHTADGLTPLPTNEGIVRGQSTWTAPRPLPAQG